MSMIANESIVLSVIAGSSAQMSRVFTPGMPVSPFSVGSCGDWKISAPEVDGAHFYLAFDGQRLHIAAVSPGSNLFVLGVGIGTSFVPLAVPCNLFFGGACIAVTNAASAASARTVPVAVLPRSGDLPDLSAQAMQVRTQRMVITASLLASLREAPNSSRSAAEHTGSHEVLPARISRLSGNLDLASTLYDGGALRERAIQLASGAAAPSGPPPDAVPAVEPAAEPSLFQRPFVALRSANPVRQALLLLAPFAIVVGVWGLRGTGSMAQASGASARPAPAHSAPAQPVSAATPPPLVVASSSASAASPTLAPPASDGLERAALAAAFSGNKLEAAQLYERLAMGNRARLFALAAQLARADRVRKP
jgi:hypothetical protein